MKVSSKTWIVAVTSVLTAVGISGLDLTPHHPIFGQGTAHYVPRFTSSTNIGNSAIYDADGNVGIGTTTPITRLHVTASQIGGPIEVLQNTEPDGDVPIDFYSGDELIGNVGLIASEPPKRFFILQVNPEGLALTLAENGGNVGIGTHTPATTLDVAGSGNFSGDLTVAGNLVVTGSKSSVAQLPDGQRLALYAVESPENWFEDFGGGRIIHGATWVSLETTFAKTVNTDTDYRVYLTPSGDCHGLYVAEKSSTGFEVRELGGGKSSVGFDYRIVARRRGFESARLESVR